MGPVPKATTDINRLSLEASVVPKQRPAREMRHNPLFESEIEPRKQLSAAAALPFTQPLGSHKAPEGTAIVAPPAFIQNKATRPTVNN